jgi:hypothetical protein
MASLTLPVKAWGLLAARAENGARVAAMKARTMTNLDGVELIRKPLLSVPG